MNLVNLDKCPACETRIYDVSTKACSGECQRTSATVFINVASRQDEPKPHLHITCRKCGFEWLSAVVDIAKVMEAW